ncbi:hypothetical protein [Pseudomonas syringae group sp. J254-4]|uniref:hypothetical protein n=1 Tax=Pseudomonas syringae group sp. J254-4 TaxID=3079589 RepID=UPI001C57F2A5|nr:hypothetical protein [Pseudomonas syringae group sp. J254-4]MDU8459291.1 hypothetical protein [Pseudomonas syringae group sp. J254-4]QXW47548.1 hypothetical protein KXJ79_19365 [Pseudomonas amygdali]
MQVIIVNARLRRGIRSFQQVLIDQAQLLGEKEWAFPSGDRAPCRTYALETDLGEMLFAVPPPWDGRQAHLFKLNYQGGTLSPDAEINIPDGLNRKVSGALVSTSGGETLICHRGTFTAFRGRVPRADALEHFHDWLMEVDDDGKTADVIAVSSTNSPSIANDIAEFLFKVKRLKEQRKAESEDDAEGSGKALDDEDESGAKWRGQEEFEGTKSYTRGQDTCEYQYLHGPLCNALHRKLDELVEGYSELKVGKHQVDLALVDKATDKAKVIFEVKTSDSMSAQLYTAFGQLAYYRHCFGSAETKLFLVLPTRTASDFAAAEFFAQANIQVLFGEAGIFENIEGESLEEILGTIL